MKKQSVKSGFIYTIGNLLIQGLAFITLPVYTRIISKDVYGYYNLYTSWIGLIGLFIGLQTSGSFSAARVRYSENEYQSYAVTAITLSHIFFSFIFFITFLTREWLSSLLGLSPVIILFLVFQSYLGYLSVFWGQYFIHQKKELLSLAISAFAAVGSFTLSVVLIYILEDDFIARVTGQFFPTLFIGTGTFLYFYSGKYPFLSKKYVPFILTTSLPLIFHHIGHQLLNQLDRIMLGKVMSMKEVALYSFGYDVGLVIQIVLGSINTAWVPWFFEARKKEHPFLKRVISYYLSLGLFLTLGYLTIFPELASFLGGPSYSESHSFIGLIVVSYFFVFLYTFPVNIQFYYANTRLIPIGTIVAAGVNFVMNCLMIPRIGVFGSACATVLSCLCLLIFHHVISRRLYHYTDVSLKVYSFLTIISLSYVFFMNYFLRNIVIRWGIGLLVFLSYAVYYRKEIQNYLNNKFRLEKQ